MTAMIMVNVGRCGRVKGSPHQDENMGDPFFLGRNHGQSDDDSCCVSHRLAVLSCNYLY